MTAFCRVDSVAQLVVRYIEDDVKARLKRRVGRHGRSMEEEVRDILRTASPSPSGREGEGYGDPTP